MKRFLASLPSTRDNSLEEPGSEDRVGALSLSRGREIKQVAFKLSLRVSRPHEPPHSYPFPSAFGCTQA